MSKESRLRVERAYAIATGLTGDLKLSFKAARLLLTLSTRDLLRLRIKRGKA